MVLFGPAGLADSFKTMGYKKSIQVADYLSRFGLTAFEYQAGRGVKIGTDAASQLGSVLADKNIQVSIHAPYFISMSSVDCGWKNPERICRLCWQLHLLTGINLSTASSPPLVKWD